MSPESQFADQFRAIAPHYDEVMSVVPYRQWVQYVRRLLKRYGWKPQRILDVATGTGTVAFLLAEMGHDVTGIDLSPEMISEAQRKADAFQAKGQVAFRTLDATRLDYTEEFDLAISLFDSLNYLLLTHDLRKAIAGVYQALKPGGAFIFDLNSEFALEKNLFSQDNFWDEDAAVKHLWTARFNKRTRVATIEMEFYLPDGRTFREVHKERAHRHGDVLHFLEEAGFKVLDTYDGYNLLPPGKCSERIFYVAKREG
jgi:ubiquinone/menaquinone biosynthesis C-methylase UbiE